MKRRSFIKNSVATGAILSVNACQPNEAQESTDENVADQFALSEYTIRQFHEAFKSGKLTAEKVVQLYQERINTIDQDGPELNSVIEMNPDAIEKAKAADQKIKSGASLRPLEGIPILLKDNIDTAGKMMTTAGSLALEGNYCDKNSWVAQKLEDAGAIILGKTNLSEWANFRSSRSSSGWSGRGGQTRNPYFTNRNPCGSSSGSGVASSANLCGAAIGTETNGSIVCPSSTNGIVGIKPTIGLVSRTGIVPIAHSHDTAGPMTRTVEDAAIILGTLTGIDPNDPDTQKSEGRSFSDYTQFLNADGLRNKRVGLATHFLGFHAEVDKLIGDAVKDMEELDATIIELDKEELNGKSNNDGYTVLMYEFKHDLNKYLENCTSDIEIRSLSDLIKFNERHADQEMPYFEQEILVASDKKGGLDSEEYIKALKNVKDSNGPNGIDRVLKEHELDVIIAPTGGPAWPIDVVNGDHYGGGSSSPAAWSGYPNITVPMGFIHGLPVGISFFAEAFSEAKLISIAYAYEQATLHRQSPEFLPSIKFNG